ncbi:response regulator [Flavobacterium franklandianum]|uniref:Response regulator n=1 Tax=Flavobacterium franklandianum TaxID=2594430 RepID=A0A553CNE8_9FLAO|nr:response regulator [Flavobacterium franklandianum]TRX22052.1 response regulator [Flavobacterium franklandianum]TRX28724.1 response regulator [Flavobacterium franklandianum]
MNKKIIWIIDDDVIYQTIINKLIQKSGVFSTHSSFMNGKEAITTLNNILEIHKEYIPDIILLDINMPVMDGWEFMEEIKRIKSKIHKKIIIYIVSSSIAIEDKNKSKTFIDIIGYIPKPISVDDLIAIVSN